jgi:hypothetical protein
MELASEVVQEGDGCPDLWIQLATEVILQVTGVDAASCGYIKRGGGEGGWLPRCTDIGSEVVQEGAGYRVVCI